MRKLLPLLLSVFATAQFASALECKQPDSAKMTEVVNYVVKKYQVKSTTDLTLTTSKQANDTCFWKLEYAAATPKRAIVLYLSPDRKYLSPLLYDLAMDPLAEMRSQNEQLSHDLAAGATPPLGAAGAPVTIVEFSDFQCPFCKRMTDVLEKEVLPKQDGKVNVVFRNFPLSMHPWAKNAAEIAECAQLQQPEAFWAMHDFFFQNQATLQTATMKDQAMAFAATVKGIDQPKFATCVDRELGLGPVTQDLQLGDKMGIHGTPTLFINGVRFDGMRSADEINQLVERAARGELVAPPETPAATVASAPSARSGSSQCAPAGGKPNGQ